MHKYKPKKLTKRNGWLKIEGKKSLLRVVLKPSRCWTEVVHQSTGLRGCRPVKNAAYINWIYGPHFWQVDPIWHVGARGPLPYATFLLKKRKYYIKLEAAVIRCYLTFVPRSIFDSPESDQLANAFFVDWRHTTVLEIITDFHFTVFTVSRKEKVW